MRASPRSAWWVLLSRGAYRIMIWTYPSEIRRDHAYEMMEAFGNRCTEASELRGIRGLPAVWLATLKDFFTTVSAEWLDWAAEHRSGRRRPRRDPRGTRRKNVIGSVSMDLRYAVRQLARKPGFTVVAVLTLALGVGANTAIFSVVNGVLLRPLAFDDPDEIVMVWESNLRRGWDAFPVSPTNFLDWVDRNDVFEGMAGVAAGSETLTGDGEAARLTTSHVSASVFSVLGVPPMLGRGFVPDENQPGSDDVAILSHNLWSSSFGGDPTVIGSTITLEGNPVEVVGVMPPDFAFRPETDLWRPLAFDFDVSNARAAHWLNVVARVRSGTTFEQADVGMRTLARALEQEYPNTNDGWSTVLIPMHEQVVENVRAALWVLFGAVGFVLVIACANVANLLLARASGRYQEMAVRAALGAGRGRLLRQLLTESLLLSMVGGAAGYLLALVGVSSLLALDPGTLPRTPDIALDGAVLLFTGAVVLVTGAAFGAVPAIQGSRADLHEGLKAGGQRSGDRAGQRMRNGLLIIQVATALMLVTGSGLLMRSFRALRAVDPGFNPENVVAMRMRPPSARYPQDQQVSAFYEQLLARVSGIPGVLSAGTTTGLPLFGSFGFRFEVVGRPDLEPALMPGGNFRVVSQDYFRTMGIPMLRGREFLRTDNATAPAVVIVDEALVRRYFPDEDPIGQSLDIKSGDAACPCEVIGVVADVKQGDLTSENQPGYYLPASQATWRGRTVVARTTLEASTAIAVMREAVSSIDPNLAVYDVQTLEQRLADVVAEPRFNTILLGIFAAVAMVLAMVGIYGVMSYNVSQRTQELGVRVALGADAGKIMLLVVGRGLALAGVGVAIGLAGAYGTTRFLSGMLFGVDPLDPATFGMVVGLILAVAALAAYLPARRAAHVDPVTALRGE